jgi:hypothetical protein
MHIREALRELWRSGAGKAGFGLLLLLLAGTVYVLTTYPLDYGERLWSNPTVWADNPKAVPPVWFNRLRGQAGVEQRIFEAREPTEIITAGPARRKSFASRSTTCIRRRPPFWRSRWRMSPLPSDHH